MKRERGIAAHLNHGTRTTVGAMPFIPFENSKYVTAFPAPEEPPRWALTGATLIG